MSQYFDIDRIARRLKRDRSATSYYQLVNAIDGAFDEARKHAATDGEVAELDAGRRSAQAAAKALYRGKGDADPGRLAEDVRRAVRDGGTPSWHESADAGDQKEYERMRRMAGLS